MMTQSEASPDLLVPASPGLNILSSTHQSMQSFNESNYATILTGRSLNPVHHQFSDQKAISIHLQKLAAMNRTKFEEVQAELRLAERQNPILNRHLSKVEEVRRSVMQNNNKKFLSKVHYHYPLEHKQLGVIRIAEQKVYWAKLLEITKEIINSQTDLEFSASAESLFKTFHYRDADVFFLDEWGSGTYSTTWESRLKLGASDVLAKSESQIKDKECATLYSPLPSHLGRAVWMMKKQIASLKPRIESMRADISMLQEEELRCVAASEFAELLSILGGPFDLFRLPREIRNYIYKNLVVFPYKITAIRIQRMGSYKEGHSHQGRLWTHPIFQTSHGLRVEAAEEFCKWNRFAAHTLSTLSSDLGIKASSALFLDNMRALSIPWSSLGRESVSTVKILRRLIGLKSLSIHLSWEQLGNRRGNSPDGISAFRSLINLPRSIFPLIEKLEIFDFQLTRGERVNLSKSPFHKEKWVNRDDFSRRVLGTRAPDTIEEQDGGLDDESGLGSEKKEAEIEHGPVVSRMDSSAVLEKLQEIALAWEERENFLKSLMR